MPNKSKKSSARPTQVNNVSNANSPPQPTSLPTRPKEVVKDRSPSEPVSRAENASPVDNESRTGDTTESAGEPTPVPTVNRKKQKRREKEAAKRIAEEQLTNGHDLDSARENGHITAVKQGRGPVKGYFTEETEYVDEGFRDSMNEPDDAFYSGDDDPDYTQEYIEGHEQSWLNTSKRKKGSKKRIQPNHPAPLRPGPGPVRPSFPALSTAAIRSAHRLSNDHIWNTSSQAERENIKQFWLELGEEERRSLVKVEKEAVLRKMKEQQKHSCSCSVCGRKRTAIEEELEVLYDAYYEELEQFANHNNDLPEDQREMPPPRTYRSLRGPARPMAGAYPIQGRIRELGDQEEELEDDEEYGEEDDEEPYSDEDYEDDLPPGPPDFFQFGNSLTVKDGILTVADDLLKNDGKHFIDMMEQLAERRMQREEEIHYPAPPLAHQSLRSGQHNHPPIDEEDEYDDEEDDEDYVSGEDDDFEGDEMDDMTEEQRMEEGRRMFQIFAARMFEQRVLTAYREKVAAERRNKLLEELDEETRLDGQREAKKAKDAAKKKEKKARQKAAKEEEKAKKDAEKAAQEAATREAEEKRLSEQRARKEEQRRRREAEKKAAEEERLRKEAERLQRTQKERERQADAERKARDAKERDKKIKEEARKKDREEREAREKEVREKKLKEEKERKEKEQEARREREATLKAEKEARDRARQEQSARPQPVALPPGLHAPTRNAQVASPHFAAATPLVTPTVPANGRHRQPSQPSHSTQPSQPSHTSSPRSQKASTEASQQSTSPTSASVSQSSNAAQAVKMPGQQPMLHHPQPSAPRSPLNNIGRGQHFFPFNGMPGLGVNVPPNSLSGGGPGAMPSMPMYQGPPMGMNQRFGPNGMHFPPGFGGPRPFQPGQGMSFPQPAGFNGPPGPPGSLAAGPLAPHLPPSLQPSQHPHQPNQQQPQPHTIAPPNHSRRPSGSEQNSQPAAIARPGPIARPSSTTPDRHKPGRKTPTADAEQVTTQLGSRALLDDSDEPFLQQADTRLNLPPVGAPGGGRVPFTAGFAEKATSFGVGNPGWSSFGSPMTGGGWGAPGPSRGKPGWSQPGFGPMAGPVGIPRPNVPRPVAVRLMLVQACKQLSAVTGSKGDGYHPVSAVLRHLEQITPGGEPPVSMEEMLGICDTEGNVQNGGGSFDVIMDASRGQVIKFVDDHAINVPRSSVGDIGSPLPVPGHQGSFGSIGSGVHQGFGPPGRSF